jgi:anthranilate synthase component 1
MVIKDSQAYIQAGCGVVADSDPGNEYQESLNKAKALLRALDEAEKMAKEHLQASREVSVAYAGKGE